MLNAYVIEVSDEVAGILVRDDSRFRFWALSPSFSELEGKRFASPWKAERSAALLARSRRRNHGKGTRT